MQYIKLFENFNDYYFEITTQQLWDLTSNYKPVGINNNHLKNIIENNKMHKSTVIFKNCSSAYPYKKIPTEIEISTDIKVADGSPDGSMDSLNKYQRTNICQLSDEWFLLTNVVEFRGKGWQYPKVETRFYKCDQLDGVLQLLKDLDII
jgi:hypothetical protein